jgi:GNAT superfamily N-acetyltransferase
VSVTIRAPRIDELDTLRDIEWSAGVLFVDAGFPDVADDEPASVEELAAYVRAGRAWVITDETDAPVGYAIVDVVDGLAHLEQISIVPEHGRKGLGGRLVEHVCDWAAQHNFAAVTLTTFTDVAWNGPFYATHGFRVINDDEQGPELRELRLLEASHGLDPELRVCMRRDT